MVYRKGLMMMQRLKKLGILNYRGCPYAGGKAGRAAFSGNGSTEIHDKKGIWMSEIYFCENVVGMPYVMEGRTMLARILQACNKGRME